MKNPLITKLLTKIQTEGRVSYGSLYQLTLEEGYRIATMERRLRELSEDNLIHPVFSKSKRNTRYISAYTAEKVEKPKLDVSIIIKDGQPVAVYNS